MLILTACSSEEYTANKGQPIGDAAFAMPNVLQAAALPSICSGTLEAYLTIEQIPPSDETPPRIPMTIRAQDGKAVYRITEKPLGEHTFQIDFECRTTQVVLLASARKAVNIIDGPNVISFLNADYFPLPDTDGDTVSNLNELILGTDPFTTPAILDSTRPTAPTQLEASSITINSINLTWNAATGAESGVVSYKIYRNNNFIVDVINPPYLDDDLSAGTLYIYSVEAINGAALVSQRSADLQVSTASTIDISPPTQPGKPTASDITSQSLELSWTPSSDAESGVGGYKIYRDNEVVGTPSLPSFTDNGLTGSTSYSYQVVAVDRALNESLKSDASVFITQAPTDTSPPSAPGDPKANNITTQSIELSWGPAIDLESPIVEYTVYRDDIIVATVVDPLVFVDGDVLAATAYSYQVSAMNSVSLRGPRSAAVTITTPADSDATPPTAPDSLAASNITTQSIELSWNVAGNASGSVSYNIYRQREPAAGIPVLVNTVAAPPYTDTGLTDATAYAYQVSAESTINAVVTESALSVPVSFITQIDNTPPDLVSTTTGADATLVTVVFSEAIEKISATTISNYTITPNITIVNASLSSDLMAVSLTTGPLVAGIQYDLEVSNVTDIATTANTIVVNSNQVFSYLISAPSRVGYQWDILALNNPVYSDTTIYVYDALPSQVVGLTTLVTMNTDRVIAATPFVSFTASQDVIVYVAYDINSPMPTWLGTSWVDSGLIITVEDNVGASDFKLYKKSFLAGTVALDNSGDALLMYTVFVASDPSASILNINSVSNPTPPSPAPSNSVVENDSVGSDTGSLIIFGVP
ncbi:MAG: fibronectin type III domain-containing protein [Thiohalomonadales bacterium]